MRLTACLAVLVLAAPVAVAADNLEEKYQGLQDAVASRNAAQVKLLAADLFTMVDQAICEPAPENADEKPAWGSHIEHAKGIGLYAEYALSAVALEAPAETLVDLVSTLEARNPKSKYLDSAYGPYLLALTRTGSAAKVPATAEKALANFPENEDLLLLLADNAITRKQPDRALALANRLVAALLKHPKPEGVNAAQWEQKHHTSLGRGYWIAGVIYGDKGQSGPADKNLRAALPLIQGNDAMLGPAYFYLGMANYQLGKMTLNKAKVLEAVKFSQQSAAINSAYAEQARHNALVMKSEADHMR